MVSREQYENRWNKHIDELTRLGWFLNGEDQDRLDDLQDDLQDVVETAAENREREREAGSSIDAEYTTIEEVYDGQ